MAAHRSGGRVKRSASLGSRGRHREWPSIFQPFRGQGRPKPLPIDRRFSGLREL